MSSRIKQGKESCYSHLRNQRLRHADAVVVGSELLHMSDPARHAQRPVRGKRMASASRTQKQNVWSGFTLVSQSVSCCHAGKCSLVFSKDLLIKYILFSVAAICQDI